MPRYIVAKRAMYEGRWYEVGEEVQPEGWAALPRLVQIGMLTVLPDPDTSPSGSPGRRSTKESSRV